MSSNKFIYQISKEIRENILSQIMEKKLTVFLIGGGSKVENNFRNQLKKRLDHWVYRFYMDVYYPEELFEELMRGERNFNLLTLENILADSVHAITIILESPGSIAELGAFANYRRLKNKLVVIVDKKHKKDKSFINLGLIRYLKKETKSKILYIDFSNKKKFNDEDFSKIRKYTIDVAIESKKPSLEFNIINAQYFFLALIYICEPINEKEIKLIIKSIEKDKKWNLRMGEIVFSSAINILTKRKEIILKDQGYFLAKEGLNRIRHLIYKSNKSKVVNGLLDKLRLRTLNSLLQKKQYKFNRTE